MKLCQLCGHNIQGETCACQGNPVIPEGFTLDPGSGQYYQRTPAPNPETGQDGEWVTWYYPETGEFEQVYNILEAPPSEAADVGEQPVSEPAAAVPLNPPQKKRTPAFLFVLPLVALLAGAILAFFHAGGFGEREEADDAIPQPGNGVIADVLPDSGDVAVGVPDTEGAITTAPDPQPPQLGQPQTGSPGAGVDYGITLDMAEYDPGDLIVVTTWGIPGQMVLYGALVAIFDYSAPNSEWGYSFPIRRQGDHVIYFGAPSEPGLYEMRMFDSFPPDDESFIMSVPFRVR